MAAPDDHETETAPGAPDAEPPVRAYATECDLVMKGGITSGVVYPLAIVEIARAFRLRCVGGTSAGAIAAAAAAAAELGRQRFQHRELEHDPDGFGQLATLPDHLGSPSAAGRGNKLLAFFQPHRELKPVFDTVIDFLDAQPKKPQLPATGTAEVRLRRWLMLPGILMRRFPVSAMVGTLVAASTALLWPRVALYEPLVWLLAIPIFLLGGVGAALMEAAARIVRALPARAFGLCSGMPPPGHPAPEEVLTPWLTAYLDRLAGQAGDAGTAAGEGRPLTFGDLARHGIRLQMMTTCLTLGRPYRLPLAYDDKVREASQFYYREPELAALFPPRVVAALRGGREPERFGDEEFYRFPLPDELPVVVAVRMSLSFPLLLSAVPLYALDYRQPRAGRVPLRCWFTDGGIGSNFPIHVFDAALPSRPTFGLDLALATPGQTERVVFPDNNGEASLPDWRPIATHGAGSIKAFVAALFNVAKDWNHEALSRMPGYRDRIGVIRLAPEEGGMNLSMPGERIRRMAGYGREAGREFVRRFGDPRLVPGDAETAMDWENHQLIRLRILLSSLADFLDGFEKSWRGMLDTPSNYERFFAPGHRRGRYALTGVRQRPRDPETGRLLTQMGRAREAVERLRGLAGVLNEDAHPRTSLHRNTPRPPPELKIRPRI